MQRNIYVLSLCQKYAAPLVKQLQVLAEKKIAKISSIRLQSAQIW